MRTFKLITRLSHALDVIKGFETAWTIRNDSQMLVEDEGVLYKVTIEKIENESIVDIGIIDKHL